MKYIEHRRHTMRKKPGKHLSQAGVRLARRVGESMGPFDWVLTSKLARAFETAIAMGFAVDDRDERLNTYGDVVNAAVDWDGGFAEWGRAARAYGAVASFARDQAESMRDVAALLPDGGRALVISHGGIIEAGVIGCLPHVNPATWGGPCDYCEGMLLVFDASRCIDATALRVHYDPATI